MKQPASSAANAKKGVPAISWYGGPRMRRQETGHHPESPLRLEALEDGATCEGWPPASKPISSKGPEGGERMGSAEPKGDAAVTRRLDSESRATGVRRGA